MNSPFKILLSSALLALFACSSAHFVRAPAADHSGAGVLSCRTVKSSGNPASARFAAREDCQLSDTGKTVHVLKLKGTFPQIAYDHGHLMAAEAHDHLLSGMVSFIRRDLEASGKFDLANAIYNCFSDAILFSTHSTFNDANNQFIRGVKDGMKEAGRKFTLNTDDIRRATVATDSGIVLAGYMQAMKSGSSDDKARAYASIAACAPYLIAAGVVTGAHSVFDALGGALHLPHNGCTGFAVPENLTDSGSLIHARNLDGDLIASFAAEPVVFLVDEQGTIDDGPNAGHPYFKYVAAATAGMTYPGGISGFNDQGIAVSLHEMQSYKVRAQLPPFTTGNIGPYLQQRILREAKSIDEAFELVKNTARYASWSILVSDSKTGETATIELTNDKVALAARLKGQARPQTNHFLSPEMQDQFYNYDFNKYLETRARYTIVSEALSDISPQKSMTVDGAIDLLSDHHDAEVPDQDLRSFGRVVVKGYTSLSTIALPKTRQLWMSSGDRYPVPHANFFGLQFDFNRFTAVPIAAGSEKKTRQYSTLPNWDQSLDTYTRARLAAEDGGDDAKALALLNQAIAEAAKDGRVETSYEFMRGRLLHKLAAKDPSLYPQALAQFQQLLSHESLMDQRGYLFAITQLYAVIASDRMTQQKLSDDTRDSYVKAASDRLNLLYERTEHFDLLPKIQLLKKLKDSKSVADSDLPDIDWVTIEH